MGLVALPPGRLGSPRFDRLLSNPKIGESDARRPIALPRGLVALPVSRLAVSRGLALASVGFITRFSPALLRGMTGIEFDRFIGGLDGGLDGFASSDDPWPRRYGDNTTEREAGRSLSDSVSRTETRVVVSCLYWLRALLSKIPNATASTNNRTANTPSTMADTLSRALLDHYV
jgi:hypothetical protein